MKAPSKNMAASLRGQSPGGRTGDPIKVSKQSTPRQGPIPGESGVEPALGAVDERSVQHYARAVGGHFGNSK